MKSNSQKSRFVVGLLVAGSLVVGGFAAVLLVEKLRGGAQPVPPAELKLGFLEAVPGSWPRSENGTLLDLNGVERPCRVVLRTPSGKLYTIDAGGALLEQSQARLTRIHLLPLTQRGSLKEVVDSAEKWARGLSPNAEALERLGRWSEASEAVADSLPPIVRWESEPGVLVEMEIRRDPRTHDWYLGLTFDQPPQ